MLLKHGLSMLNPTLLVDQRKLPRWRLQQSELCEAETLLKSIISKRGFAFAEELYRHFDFVRLSSESPIYL